jgi:hypothetical protein
LYWLRTMKKRMMSEMLLLPLLRIWPRTSRGFL